MLIHLESFLWCQVYSLRNEVKETDMKGIKIFRRNVNLILQLEIF